MGNGTPAAPVGESDQTDDPAFGEIEGEGRIRKDHISTPTVVAGLPVLPADVMEHAATGEKEALMRTPPVQGA